MLLKELRVYGFKTFGKKVEIRFQPGITAIVGPNGAGKSNLIEALNWVLGETRLSDLRVKSANELIFHGSPNLKPLSLAEVSLTIENDDNRLPIDYSEVNITRRLTKDGNSEYYLNKSRCTLRDINNLFVDTGVGKSAYSVMKQGEIDRILRKKPEERRDIFEEAAGILKYRNRRRETERDLAKAENNLKQVRPTLVEVERQYNDKKKQAERAERYQKLVDRKTEIEIDISLVKLMDLQSDREKKQQNYDNLVEKREKLNTQLKGIEKEIDSSLQQSQSLQKEQDDTQSRILQHESSVAAVRTSMAQLEEKRSALEGNIQNWTETQKGNDQRIEKFQSTIAELEEEQKNVEANQKEIKDNLEKYAQDISEINKILEDDKKNIEIYKKKIETLNSELDISRGEQEKVINELVSAIDKRKAELKESTEYKQNLKGHIARSLEELYFFLDNKHNMLMDLQNLDFTQHTQQEKLKDVLEGFTKGLKEKAEAVLQVQKEFGDLDNLISGFDEIIFAREGIHARKEQLDQKIQDMNLEVRSHRERILFLETDISNQSNKKETINQMMQQARIEMVKMREKATAVESGIKTQRQFLEEVEKQNAAMQKRIEEARESIETIAEQIKTKTGEYEQELGLQNKMKKQLTEIRKQLSEITSNSSNKEKRARNVKIEIEKVYNRIDDISRSITALDVEMRTIYDNFYENYSIDLKEHEKNTNNKRFDIGALRTEQRKIKEEMNSLGNINPLAIDESMQLKERYKLLKEQIEDIERSKSNLESIIKEINANSEVIFQQTFDRIKVNFHKIFRRLFNGGKAELFLTDPDNVLESGIDFQVQPPAKSLQAVGLLSGGESSMTAVALLFAIFMVKPSPFCLLDEIDAALDGPNIERFKRMLAEFKQTTQFLMITHNISTLKSADAMYGISMEEDGVTTAISLNMVELERNKNKYKVE